MQSCTAGSPTASPAGGGGSPFPCLRGSNAAVAASPRNRQEGAVVAAGAAAARMGLERAVSGAVTSSSKAAKNTASARSCRPAYYLRDDRVSSSRILLNMHFVLPLLLHVWFGSRFLLSGWCLPLCPTASAAATGCGGTHHGCPHLPFRPSLAATPPAGDASAITGGSGGTVSPALPAGVVSAASGAAAFIPSVSPSAASRSAVSALSTRTTSVPYTPAAASPFSGAAAAGASGWGEASPSVPAARVLGVGVLQENPPQQRRGDVHAISAVPRVSMPTAAESAASSFASAAAAACVTVRRPVGRDLPNTLPGSASPAVLPPHQSSLSRSSLAACAAGGGDVPGSAAAAPGTAAGATALEEGNGVNKQRLVSPYVAQMLYEDMLLGRALEDACFRLYYQGKTAGFVHLYTGQEAVSSGVIKLLRQDDAVVSTYRDHVHACSKGVPAKEVMAELFGKSTGCSRGRGGSMHMFSKRYNLIGGFAFIGEQIPIALGYAFSAAYRRFALTRPQSATAVPETAAAPAATAATTAAALPERHDQVTVCFLGDGTTNIGQLWEALNIAALAKLPIIFVVENNNWAIGMAAQRSTAIPRVWQRAEGFGVAGVEVDGMDVLAVRRVARRAIERARRGEGPTLIEALTYRFRGHSVADPDEMRAPKQKEAWVVRDPIIAFEEQLKAFGFANDDTIRQTRQKVDAVIKDAVQFAEKSVDTPAHECGSYIFAPAYRGGAEAEKLSEQQLHAYAEALKEELDWKARVKAGDRSPRKPITQTFNLPTIID